MPIYIFFICKANLQQKNQYGTGKGQLAIILTAWPEAYYIFKIACSLQIAYCKLLFAH